MGADVSRAIASFVAANGLGRESARELAARFANVNDVAELPEWLTEAQTEAEASSNTRDFAVEYLAQRAAGKDITPGHDNLHHYWTKGPGLARWRTWTELVANLVEEVHDKPLETLKTWAAAWFHERYGFWPGDDKNRVMHGKPPRGKRIGPG